MTRERAPARVMTTEVAGDDGGEGARAGDDIPTVIIRATCAREATPSSSSAKADDLVIDGGDGVCWVARLRGR